MHRLTLWLIVLAIERSFASKHRSVNLALETVLEFDKADDVKIVNRVQEFLTRVHSLLKKNYKSDQSRRKNVYQFSDFVEDVIIEIQSLEDKDLLEVFKIINRSIKERKANDFLDSDTRRFLSGKLSELRKRPIMELRSDLEDLLRELKTDKKSKSNYILGFINTLYERDAENKLSKFVKRLNIFRNSARKSKIDLKDIIEKVINDVIYEHYNNLEGDERRHIKKYVRSFFVDDLPKKSKTKTTTAEEKSKNEKSDDESTESEEQAVDVQQFADTTTTTKKSKNANLYPKTTKRTKSDKHKFRTGIPLRKQQEDAKDMSSEEVDRDVSEERFKANDVISSNQIFANHSFEINVNLMLKKHEDSREETLSSKRNKYRPKLSQRASTKKTKKTKHRKTTQTLYTETFGSLYKNTPKKHISKKKFTNSEPKTTMKEMILRTMMDVESKEKDSESSQEDRRKNFKKVSKQVQTTLKTTIKQAMRRVNIPIEIEQDYTSLITSKVAKINTPVLKIQRKTTPSPVVTTTTEVITTSTTESTTAESILNKIQNNVTIAELSSSENMVTVPETSNLADTKADTNNTISNETATFSIDEYLKKSELRNFENENKRKTIEEKMREDFKFLMSSPTTNTTEAITDVFKELEDAFGIE